MLACLGRVAVLDGNAIHLCDPAGACHFVTGDRLWFSPMPPGRRSPTLRVGSVTVTGRDVGTEARR